MKSLKRLFTLPAFSDELKTQQAYLLHIILWALIFVPIPYVIYTFALNPENGTQALVQATFGEVINILLLVALHRGHVKAAATIQVIAFWFFFTATAITGKGVQGEAYLIGYTLVITIAGILLGGTGALVFTILSLASGAYMVILQTQGVLDIGATSSPLSTWIVSFVLFPIGAVLQRLASGRVRSALAGARASEERYRLISEVSSDYTFSTKFNARGKMYLDWVTGAFEQMTGYTFDEYVASGGWQGHLFQDDVEIDNLAFEKLTRNKSAISEVRTFRKNREIAWVRVYAHPVWDEKEKRLTGIVGAVQDITERKLAEEGLRREHNLLQTFLDNIPDTVYIKDPHSRFIRINNAQAKFLGLDRPEDAIGKSDLDFQPPELAKQFMEEEKQILETGQPIVNRVEFNPRMDGTPRWFSASKSPVRDSSGLIIGTIGISRDVTEQKLAEERDGHRRQLLEKVISIGKQVTETQNLQAVLERIWYTIRYDLGFDRLGIYLYDHQNKTMNGTYGTNNQGEMVDEWDDRIFLSDNTPESRTFIEVLENENGLHFTQEYHLEHNTHANPRMTGVKDYAAVAAWAGNKPVAVLCADNAVSQNQITSEKLEALRLFAGFAGLAIENARLHTALEVELEQQKLSEEREVQRRIVLEKVVILGKSVTEAADLRTTLERIWHGIHDDLEFDRLGIFLYNAERQSMDDTLGTNMQGEMIEEWDIWFPVTDAAIFMRVLEKPDGMYLTHNYDVENNIPEGNEMHGVKDFAAVAAFAGDKPIAVICVDQLLTKRRITDQQLEALRLFAGYAGLAIENVRLNEDLKRKLDFQKEAEEYEASRRAMLEKVILLGQTVTEVKDLNTTIEQIWHGVHDDIGFDRLAIFLYDQETKTMHGTLGTDDNGNIVEEWNYQRTLDHEKPTSFVRALEQPNGLFYTDNFSVEFDIPEGHDMYNVKDFASVAARAGDKPVAIITVDNHPSRRPFTPAQLEALRLFGGYAGLAIQNSKLNAALQVELDQRQKLINELENKNAELERFTYTVSHDLKSPLVTITGFLGFLEQDALKGNTDRVKGSINRIAGAAKKMQKLLNDILELSRIGRLMNPPEEIPFEEIVHEAIDYVRGGLDRVDATIEIQDKFPIVYGDRVRLVEVVQNLIENSIKYNSPEVRLKIEIGISGQNEKGYPVFFVRDNGIGIEPEYHEIIFGLFNKLNAQSEGTGIGLSLVKRIIEVHNGRIWVVSERGQGATFYFSLPTPTKE